MKTVKKLLKQGVDKKEIYNSAMQEGLNPKKVSRFLANFPDKDRSDKYNTANKVLVFIYGLLSVFSLLQVLVLTSDMSSGLTLALVAFSLILPIAVIYSIYKKQAIGYLLLSFFSVKGILNAIKEFGSHPNDIEAIGLLVAIAINFSILIYVVSLKKKLFPHQNFFNSRKNSDKTVVYTAEAVI